WVATTRSGANTCSTETYGRPQKLEIILATFSVLVHPITKYHPRPPREAALALPRLLLFFRPPFAANKSGPGAAIRRHYFLRSWRKRTRRPWRQFSFNPTRTTSTSRETNRSSVSVAGWNRRPGATR